MTTSADADEESADVATAVPSLGDAVVPLLRGVVYSGTHVRAWRAIIRMESAVRDYVSVMNLDLFVEPAEGFAYLRRKRSGDDEAPSLLRRRPLSYRISLMLALLRRRLAELDSQGDQVRLVMAREELVDLVRTFHPERSNETRLHDAVNADANKLVEMGFCRRPKGQPDRLEVLRVVKAFVDAEWLVEFDERLAAYAAHAAGDLGEDEGDGE